MNRITIKLLTAAALAGFSFAALADEADIKKAVEAKLGKGAKIAPSPIKGVWEVMVNSQVYYSDEKGVHLIAEGQLVELKSGRNLTAERVYKSLPLDLAVKQVRGSGKNVVVTFEDPNCGYCKKLAKELLTVKDVTVYTFLYPVLGEDSLEKSRAIWCSADKSKTWVDWMTANKAIPPAPAKCDIAGLEKSVILGRSLRIRGTPAMYFSNGDTVPGYLPAAEIEKHFAATGG
jgi:thiol:disulfide interchange protein DsbC